MEQSLLKEVNVEMKNEENIRTSTLNKENDTNVLNKSTNTLITSEKKEHEEYQYLNLINHIIHNGKSLVGPPRASK